MHAMDGGSHDSNSQNSIQPWGQLDVCVLKLYYPEHQRFIDDEFLEFDPEEHDHRQSQQRREYDFTEMKSTGRCDVHEHIGVMHPVKHPEPRQPMVEPVPRVGPCVQENDHQRPARPSAEIQPMEQSDAPILSQVCRRQPQSDEEQGDEDGVEQSQR